MSENSLDLEKLEKLVNSLSTLVEKLDSFPFALEIIWIVAGSLICLFVYFMTRMVMEHKNESKMHRLMEENNRIIGCCTQVMNNVEVALRRTP